MDTWADKNLPAHMFIYSTCSGIFYGQMDTAIFGDTNKYGGVHPPINITKIMQPYLLIKLSVLPIFIYLLLTIMGNSMNVLDNNSGSDGEIKDDSLFIDEPNQLLLLLPIIIPTVIPVPFEE